MKISDYIVPIIIKDDLNGTGFIVDNKLITAAHVVISKENICHFIYNGREFLIGPDNNLLFEYPKDKKSQGQNNLYMDLAVYNLKNFDSLLKFEKPNMDIPCVYQGFSDSTTKMDYYDNIKLDDKDWYYPFGGNGSIRINNTYISIGGKCKGGNSGGPLFQGKYVVGLLVGNQQYQSFSLDRYIQSDYILEKFSKI